MKLDKEEAEMQIDIARATNTIRHEKIQKELIYMSIRFNKIMDLINDKNLTDSQAHEYILEIKQFNLRYKQIQKERGIIK